MSADRPGENSSRHPPRLIVGIGASAGGLEACKRFLAEMPADSGLAFVIVMHLDPSHESHIAEIFENSTESQAQEKLFELFQLALRPGGVLMLGNSETIGRRADLFQTLSKKEPTPPVCWSSRPEPVCLGLCGGQSELRDPPSF